MSKSKKATKKTVEKPTIVVTVRKIPPVTSDLQKKHEEIERQLEAIIDRNRQPGAQLSAELNAEIHCHNCGHQVEVDHNFCEQCGVKLIGICKTCGIIKKARIDPCPICPKAS